MLYEPEIRGKLDQLSPIFRGFLGIAEEAPALTSTELLAAWAEMDLLRSKMLAEMREFPVLLCPVASVPAFRHGERAWDVEGRKVEYLDAWRYSQWFTRWRRRGRWFRWDARGRGCRLACRLRRGPLRMRRCWGLRRLWMRHLGLRRRRWLWSEGGICLGPISIQLRFGIKQGLVGLLKSPGLRAVTPVTEEISVQASAHRREPSKKNLYVYAGFIPAYLGLGSAGRAEAEGCGLPCLSRRFDADDGCER